MNKLVTRQHDHSSWPYFVADQLAYRGWDNSTLAAKAGVDRSMVGRWISGETKPTIDSIRGVCLAAKVDIREGLIAAGLFTEDELSYHPDPRPDFSKVSDDELLEEMRQRMGRRGKRAEVVETHTDASDGEVHRISTTTATNGATVRSPQS